MAQSTPVGGLSFMQSVAPRIAPPVGFQGPVRFHESQLPALMQGIQAPHNLAPVKQAGNNEMEQSPGYWATRVDGTRFRGALFDQSRLLFFLNEIDPTQNPGGKQTILTLDTLLNTFTYDDVGDQLKLDDPGYPALPARLVTIRPTVREDMQGLVSDLGLISAYREDDLAAGATQEFEQYERQKTEYPGVMTLKTLVRRKVYQGKTLAKDARPLLTSLLELTPGVELLRRAMDMFNLAGVLGTAGGAAREPAPTDRGNLPPISSIPYTLYWGTCSVTNYWTGSTNLQPLTPLWLVMWLAPAHYPEDELEQQIVSMLRFPEAAHAVNQELELRALRTKLALGTVSRRLMITPYANANYPDPLLDPTFRDVFMPQDSPAALMQVGVVNGAYIPIHCQRVSQGPLQRSYMTHPTWKTVGGNPVPYPRRANMQSLAGDGSERLGIWLRQEGGPDRLFNGRWTLISQ